MQGCSTSRVTDPPKTATELYLLSTSINNAVEPLSTDKLRGRLVYVDRTLTPEKEQDYLIGAVRAKVLVSGARITNTRDQAEIIVEVRTPGVGIDRSELLVGLPGIPLGTVAAVSGMPGTAITTPELAIVKSLTQWDTAGVAYVAYWRETGELLASSGPHIGRSYREDWSFLGFSRTISNIPPTRSPEEDVEERIEEEVEAAQRTNPPPPQEEEAQPPPPKSAPVRPRLREATR